MAVKTYRVPRLAISLFSLILFISTTAHAKIIYVDDDANGLNDGSSWADAYNFLQDALADANSSEKPVEIRVAKGIYTPDSNSAESNGTGDREATFQLIDRVILKGGYAGFSESEPDVRDIEMYEAILSGDIGVIADNFDNSYHVVTGSGTGATAVLDGFTITAGNANGFDLYADGSDLYANGCDRYRFGGGMENYNNGNPTVKNCTFRSNSARYGGGIRNYNSNPTVTNCTFSENSSVIGGGGMCNGASSPTVTNCTFTGNLADIGGGMFNYSDSNPKLTNCTFSGNSVGYYGGGVYNFYSCLSVSNCIFWGNNEQQIYDDGISSSTVTYCDIQSGWTGIGNISADPLFADADLRLSVGSPCIDAGNNNSLPADTGDLDGDGNTTELIPWDLDGNPRIENGLVDMGAYEYQGLGQERLLFVDDDASPGGDGRSWATAYKYLQNALYKPPTNGDEIWVAEGTYKPDENSDNPNGTGEREAAFQLISGVAIYGGFAGGERSLDERDWTSNVTILSGDLDGNDIDVSDLSGLWNEPTRAENSYNVVTGSGTDATAVLDGFRITAGNANGSNDFYYGGGMYNYSGSPTVTNCTFSTNSARFEGGGMYNENSSPTVTNCTFSFNAVGDYGGGMENFGNSYPTVSDCNFIGNWADEFGGGMENWYDSNATVINCEFINNYTYEFGGGMDNFECNPTVINCTFIGNEGDYGAGMYNYECRLTLINCTFIGNEGDYGGMYNEDSSPTVTNCTFSGNSADYEGGGMYSENSSPMVTNCILWANSGTQIYHTGSGSTTVRYSDVQGGWNGTGNIDEDPLFIEPSGLDGIGGTADDNLRLLPGSPCIDVGDNNSVPADKVDLDGDGNTVEPIPWDLDGRDRFVDGDYNGTEIVDIGAYEFSLDYFGDIDGEPRIMGARIGMGFDEVGGKQADLNHNGIIDFEDVEKFMTAWLSNPGENNWDFLCDLYPDGKIDFGDWAELAKDWLWQADWYQP